MSSIDENKRREIATAAASQGQRHARYKPFGPEWGHPYFGKWQTIAYALFEILEPGSEVLDIGSGSGWTTVFLAESGFDATGIDIAPAHIQDSRERAARYSNPAQFSVADMDSFDLGRQFDGILVFDALHHSTRPRAVVECIAGHLRPSGWVLFGEPSWLHGFSPSARRTHAELGWVERGVTVRQLKRDGRSFGLGNFRRFYEGTAPHTGRVRDLSWQAARLVGARFSTAPQMSIWLAAQRLA
jgi:2-polyprenyl-3-methyl-5-hydroxy-6-metoxy-1,4-benzoquinol methylase